MSVAWVLAALGAAVMIAWVFLLNVGGELLWAALDAARGDLRLLSQLRGWSNHVKGAEVALFVVGMLLVSAPLWTLRLRTAQAFPAESVAKFLAFLGNFVMLALVTLLIVIPDLQWVALDAARGDPGLLLRLEKWDTHAKAIQAVLFVVLVVLSCAPLWLVRATASAAPAADPPALLDGRVQP